MRRIILIILASLVGILGLLTAYAAIDFDPDNVSPTVQATTYQALFDEAVRKRAGSSYDALDEARRERVLDELVSSNESNAVREVALYQTRELTDRGVALQILRNAIDTLDPDLYEVAVGSLTTLSIPAATALLDSTYQMLNADAASHTPLGGYRTSTVVVSREADSLVSRFQEQSRLNADYTSNETVQSNLFFPNGPEWFASFPNADDVLDDFQDSRFMEELENSPVPQEIWSLSALRPAAAYRARLREKMGALASFFGPERLVQDNLSVAKYGNHYLLVTFKDKNLSLAERLIGILETFGKDFGIHESNVEGITVSTMRRGGSGARLSYATVGDYVVAATDTALLAHALHQFAADSGRSSLGIDPVFRRNYAQLDQSGERDVAFLWFNPTRFFEITGSDRPAARRLAILARALGKPVMSASSAPQIGSAPGTIAAVSVAGDDPMKIWRYIVDVRSVGNNAVDSLAHIAGVDISTEIVPYFTSTATISYSGIEFLRRPYGYSNTGFEMYTTIPLRNAPPGFDSTLQKLFAGVTSLSYTTETTEGSGTTLHIARDTATNDPALLQSKLQPSFAVIGGTTLLIASTPDMLRHAVATGTNTSTPSTGSGFFTGRIEVDSASTNAARYLTAYLMRTDRFPPEEVDNRIDPLRRALGLFSMLDWQFTTMEGLRHGEARLIARKD